MKKINERLLYVGVDDHEVDLFEGQYIVPDGMSYNSYVILAEKTAVTDTVDVHFCNEWLANIEEALSGKAPDYLIVHHMEPDHSSSLGKFMEKYPTTKIVGNSKTFLMIDNFFNVDLEGRKVVVNEGDTLSLGDLSLTFVFAPMVHWPEVMLSYEPQTGTLFSADAFGRFGASDADDIWDDEARRYYIGIVGKYGVQVQSALKKAAKLKITTVCPLHGPVLTGDDITHAIELYSIWSSYGIEKKGVVIAYTSVYGNTEKAALTLLNKLDKMGVDAVAYDLARSDMADAVANAFAYDKLVLATTTYNGSIFPYMREFIEHLVERNFRNRKVAFIENGSWAPMATKTMSAMLEKCPNLTFAESNVKILSKLNSESEKALDALASELAQD